MTDIYYLGHITRDKSTTHKQTVSMSGDTAYYVTYAFSHLPSKVSFQLVTRVGSENMPVTQEMKETDIDVRVYSSEHTALFENVYRENQNTRSQRVLAKTDSFTAEEMKPLTGKTYHIGSPLNDDFSPEVVKYLSTKGQTSTDAQGYLREVRGQDVHPTGWKDKLEILACTDIIKVNEHEVEIVTRLKDTRQAAKQPHVWGVKEVIVTLGSEGSIIYASNRFYDIPAYAPREVVDTTGCDDTYSAGFLYCRLQGIGFEEAGKLAAAMCILKLGHSGPFDRSIEEVRAIIRKCEK